MGLSGGTHVPQALRLGEGAQESVGNGLRGRLVDKEHVATVVGDLR